MFTRAVEVTTKPGKARELSRTISDKVLNILKTQPGFVDEVVLISEENPDQILALSFWNSDTDAQTYNREHFPKVIELIQNLTAGPPKVRTFNVEQSTIHKIAAGRAA
ncbi:MAG TPA: antibiotic biosynthesis monooxygenase [Candidatus Angelobacter sp.]